MLLARIASSKCGSAYRYHVRCDFGDDIIVPAMIDSGNNYGEVMSCRLLHRLGYQSSDLKPVEGSNIVKTAKANDGLRVLGRVPKTLRIRLGQHPAHVEIQPVVLDGLSMDLNLSGPFLRRNSIDHLHSRNALQIGEQQIPLVHPHDTESKETLAVTALYSSAERVIAPGQTRFVAARAPVVVAQPTKAGTATFRASERLGRLPLAVMGSHNEKDIHVSLAGRTWVALTNHQDRNLHINAGARIGTIQRDPVPDKPRQQTKGSDKWATTKGSGKYAPKPGKRTEFDQLARIRDTFRIREFVRDARQARQAEQLLLKYYSVFSWDGEPGDTKLVEHEIITEEGVKPPHCRYRPVNPVLEKPLEAQVQKWLTEGVIEKTQSPYNAAVVIVPKKIPGEWRVCIDYRQLNKITKRDKHHIGNIADNLSRLKGSNLFSCLDGAAGYHCISIKPEHKEKTAFSTPSGQYAFSKLPFGLCNAPASYARLVGIVLRDVPAEMALPYLDDTLCHSKGFEAHLEALERVLKANLAAGLKLRPDKCLLFRNQCEYLGHIVSEDGIQPVAAYTQAVRKWPVPNTVKATRIFLGKVGYYQLYIHRYAALAQPLYEILGSDRPETEEFQPADNLVHATQALKDALTSAPILAYPDFSETAEPFILDTDFSAEHHAIGAVLSQKQQGVERVLAYGAKTLKTYQRNYSSNKGEMAAVIHFVRHFKYHLRYRPFILRTDHQALKWLHTQDNPAGMTSRWLELLSHYTFTIEHR